jgi:ureidoacrylate peracid hydrolase
MSVQKLPATEPTVEMGAAPGQSWLVTSDTVDMTRRAPSRPNRRTSSSMPTNAHCSSSTCRTISAPSAPAVRPFEKLPVVWVNWGVRKDLLNIHPSLRHAHSPRGDEPGLAEPVPGTRSEVIARGSWGAEVVDEINPGAADIQIVKHRFSAFWDTETDSILRNLGVKTLLIGGVNMDQCAAST